MSTSWASPTAQTSNYCSRTKMPSTGISKRLALPSGTRTCFGADAAKSSRARFRRSHTGNWSMKIAFLEPPDWEENYLRERIDPRHEIVPTLAPDAEVVSPFIYTKMTAEVLTKLPKLKLIATRSTGFDHIDVAECARRGVTVCNVPFYGENTVAEHTFALILALSRKVHEAFVRVRAGNFSLDGLRGFDLKDKTIGVVGAGHIGLHVIRIARGFGMKVLAFDVRRS